jgi:hypothetical protein
LIVSALLVCTLTLPSTACVSVDVDARFAAGWRPSKGYCAFGAETPALAAWCAEVNFGSQGLLALARAVNEGVLASASGRVLLCTEHVASVRRQLAAYPGYAVSELYSCEAEPVIEQGRPLCHVSVLVSSTAGARVVLDNGHVLEPGTTGGVAEYAEFVTLVDRHWVGEPPDAVAAPAP